MMTTTTDTTSDEKKKNKRLFPIAAATLAIVAGAVLYASPYWALHSLSNAVRDKDSARVSEYVDFVLLRDSIKEAVTSRMNAEMDGRLPADNPFANAAKVFASTLVQHTVDAMVSPSGVVRLLQGIGGGGGSGVSSTTPSGSAGSSSSGGSGNAARAQGGKPRFHVSYRNWSTVQVSSEGREVGFVFRRYGLLSWKMVGINGTLLDKPGAD